MSTPLDPWDLPSAAPDPRHYRSRLLDGDALLAELNEEQRAAVVHGEGPLLVLAGAGSGKTRVITYRIAYLLASGIPPQQILAITFTNKAAQEMRSRVERLIPGHQVWIGTFHSFGARLLRQYATRLNLDPNFTIYDVEDRNQFLKDILANLDIDGVRYRPEQIGAIISKAKNQLLSPAAFEQSATDYLAMAAARVYPIYERRLRQAQAMDFDDLLYLPALALRQNEELRRELDDRYRYILIDEYQDTNQAQYELVRLLARDHRNLCVVGDPDQSIYRWRGSDIRNIMDFERDYPDARVVYLPRNYRSSGAIIEAANALIAHNRQRKKKTLTTVHERGVPVRVWTYADGLAEADGVVRQIKEAVAAGRWRYRDHAIFVRINALTRLLESAFVRHGVPFQIVKGFAFYERRENKDVLAYLRLLLNPADDVAFLRVVNVPARGVGDSSLDKLKEFAAAQQISLFEASARVGQLTTIKGPALTGLRRFHQLIGELRSRLDLPPHELIALVLNRSGYEQMLHNRGDPEDLERLANVQELITAARQFHELNPQAGLAGFLEQVALASEVDSWDEQADCVSVMTLHASKGLEFPVVYILAMEEGLLPHERSLQEAAELEEERRLCFVGMTRAMRELHLCHARLREFRGLLRYAIPSGFLDELPREQIDWIDTTADGEEGPRNAMAVPFHPPPASRPPSPASPASAPPAASVHLPTRPPARPPTGTRPASTPSQRSGSVPPTARPSVDGDADPDTPLAAGVIVQHPEYGIGQVVDVRGVGSQRRVQVRFAAYGLKTFIADKASLRVVTRPRGR